MTAKCSIGGCGKQVVSRGWCEGHYKRWLRHRDPTAGNTSPGEPERFLRYALTYDGEKCLIWPFARNEGRAAIWAAGRVQLVSRLVCEDRHGPPPGPAHEAAHGCGRGHDGCVARKHLRWATHIENEADKVAHGTLAFGERNGSARLTEEDVINIRRLKGTATQQAIADSYRVSRQLISHIHRGKGWTWLSDAQHEEAA